MFTLVGGSTRSITSVGMTRDEKITQIGLLGPKLHHFLSRQSPHATRMHEERGRLFFLLIPTACTEGAVLCEAFAGGAPGVSRACYCSFFNERGPFAGELTKN